MELLTATLDSKNEEVRYSADSIFNCLQTVDIPKALEHTKRLAVDGYSVKVCGVKVNAKFASAVVSASKSQPGMLYSKVPIVGPKTPGQQKIWELLKKVPLPKVVNDTNRSYVEQVVKLRNSLWLLYEEAADSTVVVKD